MKFMTLDECCRELFLEHGLATEHKLYRAIQLGISCIRGLNMDVSGIPKVLILTPNKNQTVDLPDDYIDYVRIGLVDEKGIVRDLGLNENLALPRQTNDCGQLINTIGAPSQNTIDGGFGNISPNTYYADHFRNGEPTGRFFGLGGGNNSNGYYKIDVQNNFILLERFVGNNLYLEYLAEPSIKDGSYQIHPFIVETVKLFIGYRMIDKGMKEDYIIERRKSKARYANFNWQEMLSAMRLANKAAPRF